MPDTVISVLVVLTSGVVLALGALLTHLTWRAARRTRSSDIRALTAGFALVTLGLALGDALGSLLGADTFASLLFQRLFAVVGLGLVVYSLYGGERSPTVAAK